MGTRIRICAKCSDLFTADVYKDDVLVSEYEGYVPKFFPGEHYGDYVMLDIEAETGRILNWIPPTAEQLATIMKEEEEE